MIETAVAPKPVPAEIALNALMVDSLLIREAIAGRLDEDVPGCPGWTARDLAVHLAGVYRWVGDIVGDRLDAPPAPDRQAALFTDPDPGDDTGVLARLAEAAEATATVLRVATDDPVCWTIWNGRPPREFWIRRMMHETVVHRIDAQNVGRAPGDLLTGGGLDTAVAADGVDEMMLGFAGLYAGLLLDAPATLVLQATDVDRAWWARLGPESPAFGRAVPATHVDVTVRGTAGELLLLVWNRRELDGLDVLGDRSVLAQWRAKANLDR
ncbi:MAG: maleylpyruvate isomerase family mycothiol-dependent enzyme [Sporichthyaceae bacterium]